MADVADVADFVLVLLHSGTNAHLLHLKTNSFSAHSTLFDYYTKIIDRVDDFAENYQGRYELITNYSSDYHLPIDEPVKYMTGLKDFVEESRKHLPQDSELVQLVDNIAELINSTLYKLRFLH